MDPEILIYDEPFVGLDPISLGVILRLIRRLNDALGLTSIVVSHDVQEISHGRRRRVSCCRAARSSAPGTPQQLQSNPSEVVRQFMGGLADGPVAVPLSGAGLFRRTARRARGHMSVGADLWTSLD